MILTLSGKTCALMRSVHGSGWHVLTAVAKSLKGRASRCPGIRRRVTIGGGLKTPQMRMVILQMGQAPPIHHVTQAVRTLNRLLICDKISEISENWSNARVLCTALVVGWVAVQPPVGVGQNLGPWGFPNSGWVGLIIHPPPR